MERRFPIGAELIDHSTHFRVWAPEAHTLEVVLENSAQIFPLQREENGYFSGAIAEAKEGTLYRFNLETAVGDGKLTQSFEPQSLLIGGAFTIRGCIAKQLECPKLLIPSFLSFHSLEYSCTVFVSLGRCGTANNC